MNAKAKHTALAVVSFLMLAGPDLVKLLEGNFSSWKDAVRGVLGWAIAFCTSGKAVAVIGSLWPDGKPDERKPDSGIIGLLTFAVLAGVAAVWALGISHMHDLSGVGR